MAIIRRGGDPYVYLTEWVGGRVVTTYLGRGALGEQRAQRVEDERAEHRRRLAAIRVRARAGRDALANLAAALDDRAGRACELAALVMEAAGFHRHRRGEWRRRRDVGEPGKGLAVVDRAEAEREIGEFLGTMAAGQPGAERKAREFFALAKVENPAFASLLVKIHGGDPAGRAEDDLVARLAGDSPLAREATRERLRLFREELAGPGPVTGLERVLVDEVTLAWLALRDASDRARRMDNPEASRPAVVEFYQRQEERAHRRFLRVAKALDAVRRKALPALQVNVVGERVGVMVAGAAGSSRAELST